VSANSKSGRRRSTTAVFRIKTSTAIVQLQEEHGIMAYWDNEISGAMPLVQTIPVLRMSFPGRRESSNVPEYSGLLPARG
jgi:hypothetical protein